MAFGEFGGLSKHNMLTYENVWDRYGGFTNPRAVVYLGDDAFSSKDESMPLTDIHVELSSGFEASVATFRLYNVYDASSGKFKYHLIEKQVVMGNSVLIQMGYMGAMKTVFVGFVSGVAFGYDLSGLPYIEVTAMDIKGIMMGGNYSNQLTASTYSAAVKEVLTRTGEQKLEQMGGVTGMDISNTPDAEAAGGTLGGGDSSGASRSTPITVEMVNESDYEFVVRAAKRYNFEFFVDRGKVLFRPAKSDKTVLMSLGVRKGIQTFHIEYSMTGVVGMVEARAMDPGKGQVISAKSKFNNTISTANKAEQLVGKSSKVYLDPSISSREDAEARVKTLMDQMSHRLGSIEANCVGIPDLVPGYYLEVSGMGTPVDNDFYLTAVTHDFSSDNGYQTIIHGCAAEIKSDDMF